MNASFLYFLVACMISSDVYAANCEPGWREFKNDCYLFSSTKSSWHDARKSCEGKKAHLATVTSEDEHNFIVQQIILEGTGHNWIGGNDIGREGVWAWEHNGKHFKFSKWSTSQPDNYNKKQHCLLLHAGMGLNWDDNECGNKSSFVCEKPKKMRDNVTHATEKGCTCHAHC